MLRYFDSVGISLDSRLQVLARRDFAGMISVAIKSADATATDPAPPSTWEALRQKRSGSSASAGWPRRDCTGGEEVRVGCAVSAVPTPSIAFLSRDRRDCSSALLSSHRTWWPIVFARTKARTDDGYRKAHRSRRSIGGRAGSGDGHGRCADGVGGGRAATPGQNRPDHVWDHLPDTEQILARVRQEPVRRTCLSRPEHRVRPGHGPHGVVARHRALPRPPTRRRTPGTMGAWRPGLAR